MNDPQDTDWICIASGPREALMEASLVLTAVYIEHHIEAHENGFGLLVPTNLAMRATSELQSYDHENRLIPTPVPSLFTIDSGWIGVLGYLLVLWMLPWLESNWALAWREAGNMHAGLVRDGEWWRCVTALTLHADLGHIIANSAFGAVFGLFVGRYLGSGFGWLLVLISGALGNGLNAWVQPDEFRSIGASTATFAALGLGATYVWRRGYFRGRGWRRGMAPVFAAIALLVYTGVGGENTDVVAHFMGFAAGVALAVLAATFDVRRLGVSGQYLAGLSAVGLLLFSWQLALGTG
ncbi:MAG: rhomboid family intramembrane serine protease [Gammaproteobacteria bacterium]|nr:rhomboid family intramembrane serine protease [Gammaproteobacteria bacterium]